MSRLRSQPLPRRPVAWRIAALATVAVTVAAFSAAPAPTPANPTATNAPAFIRFVPDGSNAGRVETVIRTYRGPEGVELRLFGAVHVADPAYYRDLQRRFTECDALLYEMIRDPDALEPGEAVDTANPLSQLQIGMKKLLQLEFQLQAIDYSPTNFVHADLDPVTFFRLQRERQESLMSLMVRVMMEEQARLQSGQGSTLNSFQLLMALMNPDRGYALKLVLGRQMSQIENLMAGLEQGSDGQGSVIVGARNERALEVMRQEIAKGKRRLGIFYGAGHLPDFDRRLTQSGFTMARDEWITAWDIRPRDATKPPPARAAESP